MTIVNSAFTVNGSLPTDAVAVAAGSTVTLAIQNTSGINGISWAITGNDHSSRVNPTLAVSGSPQGAVATFVMPADAGDSLGQAYRVRCVVSDGGSPANTSITYAVIGVANPAGLVPVVTGEELDRDPDYGWTMVFNRALAGAVPLGTRTAHGNQTTADGIHGIVGLGPYASAALRRAAVLVSADVDRVAKQTDTTPPTRWIVDSVSAGVGTWSQLTTVAEVLFDGHFESLFPGITLTCVVAGKGMTAATTLLHTAGSGPVLGLSAQPTTPTAITVTCPTTGGTLGVWQGLITYGDGTTQAFTSAATVTLTGRGAGGTLTVAAGTAGTSDVWKATAASWTDQTGNGKHFANATASHQPVIGADLAGKACVSGDGVDDEMAAAVSLAAPGTTPTTYLGVFRIDTYANNTAIVGADSFAHRVMMEGSSPTVRQGNTSGASIAGPTPGTWGVLASVETNSTADRIKFGTNEATGSTVGENAGATSVNLFTTGGLVAGKASCALMMVVQGALTPAQIATFTSAVNVYFAGGGVQS